MEDLVLPNFAGIFTWFQDNSILGIGIILAVIGLIFTISELRVYMKHNSDTEQLILWLMVLVAGIITILFRDWVLGLLTGLSILMIVETVQIWDTPVWGKLMAATTATYLVILLGRAIETIYNLFFLPAGQKPNDQIFSIAFSLSFFVFLGVAFYFFGRKFILVSKFSSPEIVYLVLFGVVYTVILFFRNKLFPTDSLGRVYGINIFHIQSVIRHRILFAEFSVFEALALVMIFMYFISGWLLTVLLGVKPVNDEHVLQKVQEVAKTMGIKSKVKVGFSPAPILNAFAYGPFFDKRIAFISSDLSEFTDEDINGIVGHELAHTAHNHVLILLGLSILELVLKKLFLLPATVYDYAFFPKGSVQTVDFVQYYIITYVFFVFILIFVRMLEGDADKATKDAGYGRELTQALFRLEGFYNGVASDFGVSVNLLTDRKYTIHEKRRFTAQAARNLYNEILLPSRASAFSNIFQSHPRTSYRIAALVVDDKNPRNGAFYSYRLLGFFMRKKAIKSLNKSAELAHKAMDKTYLNDYGVESLKEVIKYNPWKESYQPYLGRNVVVFEKFTKKVYTGEFSEIKESDKVSSPFIGIIDNQEVDLATSLINYYYPGEKYFLKNGKIFTLEDYKLDDKKGLLLTGKLKKNNGNSEEKDYSIQIDKLGLPVNDLKKLNKNKVLVYEEGYTKVMNIDEFEFDGSWDSSQIKLNNETKSLKNYIASFPPLGFEIRKEKVDEQKDTLKFLLNKKIVIYTKENFDVSLSGYLRDVNDETLTLEDADGKQVIKLKDLQYVFFEANSIELINKNHISLFTKISLRWSNRNEFNYIIP